MFPPSRRENLAQPGSLGRITGSHAKKLPQIGPVRWAGSGDREGSNGETRDRDKAGCSSFSQDPRLHKPSSHLERLRLMGRVTGTAVRAGYSGSENV
jgi:hypothetical protein